MSGSSSVSVDTTSDAFADAFTFDFSPTTFSPASTPYAAINHSLPPLPALFPSDSVTPTTFPSRSPPDPPPVELDLTTAPRGCGRNKWPWRYVCDMAAGFDAMRRVQDSQPSMTREAAFEEVFKCEYKATTFADQWRAWRAAGRVSGERERWIRYQRSEAGEWREFMREWRQGGA